MATGTRPSKHHRTFSIPFVIHACPIPCPQISLLQQAKQKPAAVVEGASPHKRGQTSQILPRRLYGAAACHLGAEPSAEASRASPSVSLWQPSSTCCIVTNAAMSKGHCMVGSEAGWPSCSIQAPVEELDRLSNSRPRRSSSRTMPGHSWTSQGSASHAPACNLSTLRLNMAVCLSAVLVSNLGGSTSGLLSLDGGRLAGRLKLDALYPVAGHKRCLDTQNGYGARPPHSFINLHVDCNARSACREF